MKKSKLLNMVLTSIMLLNTILPPQITYALSDYRSESNEEELQDIFEEDDNTIVKQVLSEEKEESNDDGSSGEEIAIDVKKKVEEPEDKPAEKITNHQEGEAELYSNKSPPVTEESGVQTSNITPQVEIQENLISGFEMKYTNKAGVSTIIEDNADIELDIEQLNGLALDYTLKKPDNLEIADGTTYTIDLPAIFGEAGAGEQQITIDGTIVGTYVIEDNQVVITFNDQVNKFDDIDMHVNISGAFNTEIFETVEEIAIEVPFQDGNGYTATIRAERANYEGEDKKEAKDPYVLDGEKKLYNVQNPEFVDWTVRANDSRGQYENATIIDELGEHLEIVEDSFVVHRLVRNYNNEIIDRVVVDATPEITTSGFELNLGAIEDAYEISYTTRLLRPEGGGQHPINNNARIILDNDTNEVSDSVTGTWSTDIPTITKSGTNTSDPHVIDWTVKYNYGMLNLGTVTLTDELSDGEIDWDTLKIYEVKTNINGEVTWKSDTPTVIEPGKENDGNLTLPDLDADGKAYLITFSSSVPVGMNGTINNEISDNLKMPNSDDDSVDVNTIPTGGKVGEQKIDKDGHPYIEWTITMNSEKINVGSIDIIDVFSGEHLKFDVDDSTLFELYKDGVKADNFDIAPYTHTDDRTGFALTVTDAGPHTYEFVYRTHYTSLGMQEPQLANQAELIYKDGEGIGIGEPVKVGDGITGPIAGVRKFGEYLTSENRTTQEIEWTIIVNESRILLENPIISDDFTSKNYELIDGSLSVVAVSLNDHGNEEKETLTLDTDYTLNTDTKDHGFVIHLPKNTNKKYIITYRTTVDDENKDHTNFVTFDWQGGSETDEATVNKRNPGISKHYSILTDDAGIAVLDKDRNKTINWIVDFNTNQNVLHNVVITDTNVPADADISNIKLFKNEVEMASDEFTLTPIESEIEDGKFTIEIAKLDAVPYRLTYSSTLTPAQEAAEVSNAVNIDYTGGDQDAVSTVTNPTLGVQKEAISIDKESETADYINWRIIANTDTANHLVNLVNPVLTDTIPSDQKLVKGSITAVRKDNENIIIDQSNINENDNSFSINLPNGPYQYIVTFKTEILEYPSVNKGKLDRYTNSTTLTDDNRDFVSADAYIDYFSDGTDNNNQKTGEVNEVTEDIDWNVTVNPLGLTINNAVISDALSDNQTYVEDSIKVMNQAGNEISTDLYEMNLSEDNRSFTIRFKDTLTEPIKVSYSSRLNPELIGIYNVSNAVELRGGQTEKELSKESKTVTTSQWTYGGGGSGKTLNFTINKMHEDGQEPIPGVKFKFLRITPTGTEVPIDGTLTTDEQGQIKIDNARAGRYIVTETEVPEGFVMLDSPLYMTIGYANPNNTDHDGHDFIIQITDSNWQPINIDAATGEGNLLTVYNEVETGEISATKTWVDGEKLERPTTWLRLYRSLPNQESEPVEEAGIKEISSQSSSTTVKWEKIDLYSPAGIAYDFTVREVDAEGNDFTPENYVKTEEGLEVTNHYVIPTEGVVQATKQWQNGPEEKPTVWFKLFRQIEGGEKEEVPKAEIKALTSGTTSVEWTGLEETDLQGNAYIFSVQEVDKDGNDFTPVNYVKTENGLIVTNDYIIPSIDVTVRKNWIDGPETKPSIAIQLYRDGVEIGDPVTLNGSEEIPWTYTWTDLEKTTLDGHVYTYSVDEVNTPENYVKSVEGLEVTNAYVSPKREFTGTKVWVDGPKETPVIEMQLLRNGEAYGEPVALASGVTDYTWTDLDVTDRQGKVYEYTIDEVTTPVNYEKSISDDGQTITNQYVVPTKGIAQATKKWVNGPSAKPTVWFKLFRQIEDGDLEEVPGVDIQELTNGTTSVEWTDLEETDINGNPYIFSVQEVDEEGNDFTPENYVKTEKGLEVTNHYVIPTEGVAQATKKWVDGPSTKPTVWFKLFRQIEAGDLEEVPEAEIKELANGVTEVEWTSLEETDINGHPYTFSVQEVDEDGNDYTPVNYVKTENGLNITNYYVSPTDASAKATKKWVNGPTEKPTIWFKLFRQIEGGDWEEVPEAKLKELTAGITEVVWNELTRTDSFGNEYIFSVQEVDEEGNDYTPENYVKTEEGLLVTNQYVIPKMEVTGTKVWIGGSDKRPSIELQLFRDGEAFGKPVTIRNGTFEYTWVDLDQTDINGDEYIYTIDEVNVPENYEKTISRDGLTITNTYTTPVSEKPEDSEESKESEEGSDLPQTGEASSYIWLALSLVVIGVGTIYFNKKRYNQ